MRETIKSEKTHKNKAFSGSVWVNIRRENARWECRSCQLCGVGPLSAYWRTGFVTLERRAAILCGGCHAIVTG